MQRTNHTMSTIVHSQKQTPNNQIITNFESYVFGGLILNSHGQLKTSNDLIVVRTRLVTDKKQVADGETIPLSEDPRETDVNDLANYAFISPVDDTYPVERRDHSATLMRNNTMLLIYGGRNDNASTQE